MQDKTRTAISFSGKLGTSCEIKMFKNKNNYVSQLISHIFLLDICPIDIIILKLANQFAWLLCKFVWLPCTINCLS